MDDEPRLTELDFTVITITQDQEGYVTLDSDVDDGQTLLLERARLMLVVPEFFEPPDDDD